MKKTLNAVTDVYNKAKNFIISGSGQFTTKVRNILKKCGNEIIHSIVVCRSPVPSMIQKAHKLLHLIMYHLTPSFTCLL